MNLRERASQASVLLEIPDGDSQTAWFFTDKGHLISAGHGIKKIKNAKDFEYKIVNQKKTWIVKLLDYEVGIDSDALDFAIFQIVGQIPHSNTYLPISRLTSNEQFTYPESDAFICGYAGALGSYHVSFSVEVQSKTRSNNSNRSYILCTGSTLDAKQMSGGALFLEHKNISSGAIGLQVLQPKEFQSFYAAQSLTDIFVCNETFRNLVIEQWEREKDYVWPLKDLEAKFSNHSKIGNRIRRALFTRQYDAPKSVTSGLYDELLKVLHAYKIETQKLIKSLIWLDANIIKEPIFWKVSATGWFGTQPLKINQVIANDFQHAISGGHTKETNLLVDLSGQMEFEDTSEMSAASTIDLVVIQVNEEPPQIKIGVDKSIDLFITITADNQRNLISQICFILEDIILDECIFQGIPILRDRFRTLEARTAYTHAKLEYIRQNKDFFSTGVESMFQPHTWHLGGMPIPTNHIGYFPLSTYARVAPNMAQDSLRLSSIWRSFVNEFLLPALCEREEGLAPVLEDDAVVRVILEKRLFGGMVSERRLREVLRASSSPNVSREFTELVAIILYKRKPKKRFRHALLFNLFKSRRLGSIAVIREGQLQQLFDLLPYVEFYLLRRA